MSIIIMCTKNPVILHVVSVVFSIPQIHILCVPNTLVFGTGILIAITSYYGVNEFDISIFLRFLRKFMILVNLIYTYYYGINSENYGCYGYYGFLRPYYTVVSD